MSLGYMSVIYDGKVFNQLPWSIAFKSKGADIRGKTLLHFQP
jgi:hypothetical protein